MDKPFQRKGAKSNTHVGKEFERSAKDFFTLKGLHLQKDISIDIGIDGKKRIISIWEILMKKYLLNVNRTHGLKAVTSRVQR